MTSKPQTEIDVDPCIERASTLASRFYIEPSWLEIERKNIFHATWQYAGRLEQLPEPGSYFTADIAGEPVVVLRDKTGQVRAFHNACRHRAGPVASGSGCRSSLQCGYHGWTYGLDGKLIGTPEFDGVENFQKSDFGLIPLEVDIWEGSVFVRVSRSAKGSAENISLADYLGEIPAEVAPRGLGEMKLVERRDYHVNCNWKVYVDNYLEGYHVPIVHPSLMRELDYNAYRTITRRYHSLQFAPIKPSKPGDRTDRRYTSPEQQTEAAYYWIFPNLMLNVYPDNFSVNLIVPIGHDRTLTIFEWYFADPESDFTKEQVEKTIPFSDEIQIEDINICEAVQRGLKSASYDRGRYSVRRENGVHHFHLLYSEFMNSR